VGSKWRIGERNCVYRILVCNSQRKRPLRRAKREWYNIKYIRGECKDVDLIILFRIRSSGGFLWTQFWTFGFFKRRECDLLNNPKFFKTSLFGDLQSLRIHVTLLQGWALPQPSTLLLAALRKNKDLCGVNPHIGHSKLLLLWSIFRQFSACWVYS